MSARLRCVLAICDQGLGACAVGAARKLDGPVRHGPLERLRPNLVLNPLQSASKSFIINSMH